MYQTGDASVIRLQLCPVRDFEIFSVGAFRNENTNKSSMARGPLITTKYSMGYTSFGRVRTERTDCRSDGQTDQWQGH